ncbi:sorting nexin-20 [Patella vulgata]|uniref:sorting nexin-20 n=1 Tax=Patella vulgata TaxID=6465 RepID=UPI00217F543B|nr:sorting nexin-20 [Patella vulgata]
MSFLKKLSSRRPERFLDSVDIDPQELDLADDQDEFIDEFAGTLNLTLPDDDVNNEDIRASHILRFNGRRNTGCNAVFEVMSADIVKENRSSYVLYTIQISSHTGDIDISCIERRFSDFEKLNTVLRKRFPDQMEMVAFPRKVLVGNFRQATIATRSRAFEQYLSHLYAIYQIRYCRDFLEFFLLDFLRDGYKHLQQERHRDAIKNLEYCLPITEKLYGNTNSTVINILCALVVCYQSIERLRIAQKYSEAAVLCFDEDDGDETYIAVLIQAIRLSWELGKDKQDLELKLQKIKNKNIDVETIPELKLICKQRCQSM